MVQGPNLQRDEIAGWCSLLTTASTTMVLALSLAWRPTPWLVWNASESAPIGLYVVHPLGKPMLNDLVIVIPPEPLATFLAEDSYLPHGVPMLKQVRALGGQTVCRIAYEITIVGILVGRALDRDHRGRLLPKWQGCHVLAKHEVFVMNSHPSSLDARYFGVLPISSVVGPALPLWTAAAVSDVSFLN